MRALTRAPYRRDSETGQRHAAPGRNFIFINLTFDVSIIMEKKSKSMINVINTIREI